MYAVNAPAKKRKGGGGDDGQKKKQPKVVRPQRVLPVRLKPDENYFVAPVYGGAWTKYSGGASVTATVTYRAVDPANYGSGPATGECNCVSSLNLKSYKGTTWVAGHLLNDNLGGPGVSKNLTAMTSWRNRTFNGDFEQAIKAALIKARQLDDAGGQNVWYGVKIRVTVGGFAPGTKKWEQAVRDRVDYSAVWVRVTKKANASERVITQLTRNKPHPSLPDLPQAGHFDPGETNPNG